MDSTKKAVSILSKKRYQQISDTLHKTIQDEDKVKQVLEDIKTIMNFDPSASRYNEHVREHIQAYRLKKRNNQQTTM